MNSPGVTTFMPCLHFVGSCFRFAADNFTRHTVGIEQSRDKDVRVQNDPHYLLFRRVGVTVLLRQGVFDIIDGKDLLEVSHGQNGDGPCFDSIDNPIVPMT